MEGFELARLRLIKAVHFLILLSENSFVSTNSKEDLRPDDVLGTTSSKILVFGPFEARFEGILREVAARICRKTILLHFFVTPTSHETT